MDLVKNERIREMVKVYFIMGSVNCRKNPVEVLKEAIAGGITIFQFREKGEGALEGKGKLMLAQKLRELCRIEGIPFIVNDDIELALAVDADGVHIGQDDEPIGNVREMIGDKIFGISVHTVAEAENAIHCGADYFGTGPVFPTNTKIDTKPVCGVIFIKELRSKGYKTPVVGIGGITVENALSVTQAGADGVSVITAVTNAEDIPNQVKKLKTEVIKGISIGLANN